MTADASSPLSRPAGPAVIVVACVFAVYLIALHALIVSGRWPLLALVMVVLPWLVALGSTLLSATPSNRRSRIAWVGLVVVLCAAVLARYGEALAARADLMLYLENLAFFLALAAMFAVSLIRGEALITRLARVARKGDMPPAVVRYTRLITIGWSVFFAATAAVSSALFFTQSRTVWSTFVNLAIWPLVAATFALEYAIRVRVLRDVRHVSMMTGVRAFRQRATIDRLDAQRGPR